MMGIYFFPPCVSSRRTAIGHGVTLAHASRKRLPWYGSHKCSLCSFRSGQESTTHWYAMSPPPNSQSPIPTPLDLLDPHHPHHSFLCTQICTRSFVRSDIFFRHNLARWNDYTGWLRMLPGKSLDSKCSWMKLPQRSQALYPPCPRPHNHLCHNANPSLTIRHQTTAPSFGSTRRNSPHCTPGPTHQTQGTYNYKI